MQNPFLIPTRKRDLLGGRLVPREIIQHAHTLHGFALLPRFLHLNHLPHRIPDPVDYIDVVLGQPTRPSAE